MFFGGAQDSASDESMASPDSRGSFLVQKIALKPAPTLEAIQFRLRQRIRHQDAVSAAQARYAIDILVRLTRLLNSGRVTPVATRRLLETARACDEGRLALRMLQALVARDARAIRQSALPTRQQQVEEMAAASAGMAVAGALEDLLARAAALVGEPTATAGKHERLVNDLLERARRLNVALGQLTGAPLTQDEAQVIAHGVRDVVGLDDNRLYAGTRFAATMGALFRTRRPAV
jgi:hypothetical protein